MKTKSVLFLGKNNDPLTQAAYQFCKNTFSNTTFFSGNWGDAFPAEARVWKGDLIISYLSRWIIPESVLKSAGEAAINFHPAPPEYPGIGGLNFALYEGAKTFGVTCHHMLPAVDAGPIISTQRFPIHQNDSVETLHMRTATVLHQLFYEIILLLEKDQPLPQTHQSWSKTKTTRKDLDGLMKLTSDMTEVEIKKRIRSTQFGQWIPKMENSNET